MNVWALETGTYSDYHVIGVFSSKENAEKMRTILGGEVAEWDLDPDIDKANAGLRVFYVEMDRDGNVKTAKVQQEEPRSSGDCLTYDGRFWCSMWASDRAHAIKIASERRFMAIATRDLVNASAKGEPQP